MRVVGIRRKSDGEIIMAIPFGTPYRLPDGLTSAQVEVVPITIPENIIVPPPSPEQIEESNRMVKENEKLEKIAGHFGIQMSDFIEKAAAALGIPHCKVCEMRKKILHKIHESGWWKAMALIWKTIKNRDLNEEEKRLIE